MDENEMFRRWIDSNDKFLCIRITGVLYSRENEDNDSNKYNRDVEYVPTVSEVRTSVQYES